MYTDLCVDLGWNQGKEAEFQEYNWPQEVSVGKGHVLRGAETPPAGSMRLQGLAKMENLGRAWSRAWAAWWAVPTHFMDVPLWMHWGFGWVWSFLSGSLAAESEKVAVMSENWGSSGVVSWEERHSPMFPRSWPGRLGRLDSWGGGQGGGQWCNEHQPGQEESSILTPQGLAEDSKATELLPEYLSFLES